MRAGFLLPFFTVAFTLGWYCGHVRVANEVQPAHIQCPEPKPEPERCMAFWFGEESMNDRVLLRRKVCGIK